MRDTFLITEPGEVVRRIVANRKTAQSDPRLDILLSVGLVLRLTGGENDASTGGRDWALHVGRHITEDGEATGYFVEFTDRGVDTIVFHATFLGDRIGFDKYVRGPWEQHLASWDDLLWSASKFYLPRADATGVPA